MYSRLAQSECKTDHCKARSERVWRARIGPIVMTQTDLSDQLADEFLVLIGRIVIGWGMIERALDIAILAGRSLIPEFVRKGRAPHALQDKAKALRAVCQRLPSFKTHIDWVDKRMNEFLELSEIRHTIVHGHLHGIAQTDAEPVIYFRRAPPLSGASGDRLIATRGQLEGKLKTLKGIDSDLSVMILLISQEVKRHV